MPGRRDYPEMPEGAASGHFAIAGVSRLTTLRHLLDHPKSTRREIVDGTGLSEAAVRFSIEELEDRGYVTADVPSPRTTKNVRYSALRPKLTDDLHSFVAWLLR